MNSQIEILKGFGFCEFPPDIEDVWYGEKPSGDAIDEMSVARFFDCIFFSEAPDLLVWVDSEQTWLGRRMQGGENWDDFLKAVTTALNPHTHTRYAQLSLF